MNMERMLCMLLLCLSLVLCGRVALATPVNLDTFIADPGVSESGGVITLTEDINYSAIYFWNDAFAVPADALALSFDYSLILGTGNDDWLVAVIDTADDGFIDWPDDYYMEISNLGSGSWSINMTGFQDQTIFLGFGLESNDLDIGTVATISNLDLEPVPEPASVILMGSGLVCLFGIARKKLFRIF